MSEFIDNRAQRMRTLKDIIVRLHDGESPAAVKPLVSALVRECHASEVAAMEQELMAEGMAATEVMRMCDLHAEVLRDAIVTPARALTPGHPADTFRRENDALRDACARLRALAGLVVSGVPDDEEIRAEQLHPFRAAFNELMDVDKHYRRKEHLLFPFLERHGISGPSTVMWGKDDEVRRLLSEVETILREGTITAGEWRVLTAVVVTPALSSVEEMILKEEKVLLPLALETLSEIEWGEIWAQSPQIGWCLVDPRQGWQPPREDRREGVQEGFASSAQALVFPSGSVSAEQLSAIFAVLPVDLTFVDADDRVQFFTEGTSRVFPRAKAIIGRKVQNCHPPASVHIVDRILSDFREGRQHVAAFWITFRGRFVHIRYFAVRDAAGSYLGTVEVTQDLTEERSLAGERRLLQYD